MPNFTRLASGGRQGGRESGGGQAAAFGAAAAAVAPPHSAFRHSAHSSSQHRGAGSTRSSSTATMRNNDVDDDDQFVHDLILDNTFGDSLQSLSDSLSGINDNNDNAAGEGDILDIIEERRQYHRGRGRWREKRNRNLAVLVLVVAVMGGVVISLSVMAREYEHGGESSAGGGPLRSSNSNAAGGGGGGETEVETETQAWEDACSPHSVSTKQGRAGCKDACQIYECCAIDPKDDTPGNDIAKESCVENKAADCKRFWRLCDKVLELDTDSSAAAAAIAASTSTKQEDTTKKLISQACVGANTNSAKFQECTELCQGHLCCFEMYGGGCKDLEEYECDRYDDCSVLAMDLAQAIVQHVGMEHKKEEAEEEEKGGRYR
mmetsp:Transcript_16018/g.34853  ORF Transcript_16018/g.34853 Transcript_16018/m.34853 type:complete len:377 (-) Transcript_16018:116-1246(-)